MFLSKLARLLVHALLIVLIVATVSLASVIYVPQLSGVRASVAVTLLNSFLEAEVETADSVLVAPGAETHMSMSDVSIRIDEPGNGGANVVLKSVNFSFPTLTALRGSFQPKKMVLSGIEISIDGSSGSETEDNSGESVIAFISWLLDEQISPELTLKDLRLVRQANPDGWNGVLTLAEVTATTSGSGTSFRLSGDLDGARLALVADAKLSTDDNASRREIDVRLDVPGATANLTAEVDGEAGTLAGNLEIDASSTADLLATAKLATRHEGKASLEAKISGTFDSLAAKQIDLSGEMNTGERFSLSGDIGDIWKAEGLGLDVSVDLSAGQDGGVKLTDDADIALKAVSGLISGSPQALVVERIFIETNLASNRFSNIGPISIDRVVRSEDKRLGLIGIRVLEGNPDNPSLEMAGDLKDVIGLSGLSLSGEFDVDLVAEITGQTKANAPRLRGELAVSDKSGTIAVDTLMAKTTGDGVLALEIQKTDGVNGMKLHIASSDLDALGALLETGTVGGGEMSFDGEMHFEEGLRLSGDLTIGMTSLEMDLVTLLRRGQPILEGSIDATVLRVSDLQRGADIASAFKKPDNIEASEEITDAGLLIDLRLSAEQFAGAQERASGLTTRLKAHKGRFHFKPLRATVFGGVAEGELNIQEAGETPLVAVSGTLERAEMSRLLSSDGSSLISGGTLNADLDLRAQGDSTQLLLGSLGGDLSLSFGDALLGTRLLDLTGQDIVSWLFADQGEDGPSLKCGVAAVSFDQGVGEVETLIIETTQIQLTGQGSVDLGQETLDLAFSPKPLRDGLLDIVTPFTVSGALDNPEVSVGGTGAVVGRGIAEALTLPVRPLTLLREQLTPDGEGGGGVRPPCELLSR